MRPFSFSEDFGQEQANYCGGAFADGGCTGVVGLLVSPGLLLPKPVGCPNGLPFGFALAGCPFGPSGFVEICNAG